MYIYLLRWCDSSIGIGKATRHHEFNNDEIGFCLLFSFRNRLSWADCISMAIKYAILYLHIILLVLPDTFYLDESGAGFDRIRIQSFLRCRIRSKSVRIRNTVGDLDSGGCWVVDFGRSGTWAILFPIQLNIVKFWPSWYFNFNM
jgi:hypothetical protein